MFRMFDFLKKNRVKEETVPKLWAEKRALELFNEWKQGAGLLDVAREAYKGIGKLEKPLETLEPEERDAFLAQAYNVSKNTAFIKIIQDIADEQIRKSFEDADSFHTMEFGRATVNGAYLVRERIGQYASEYEATIKEKEESVAGAEPNPSSDGTEGATIAGIIN